MFTRSLTNVPFEFAAISNSDENFGGLPAKHATSLEFQFTWSMPEQRINISFCLYHKRANPIHDVGTSRDILVMTQLSRVSYQIYLDSKKFQLTLIDGSCNRNQKWNLYCTDQHKWVRLQIHVSTLATDLIHTVTTHNYYYYSLTDTQRLCGSLIRLFSWSSWCERSHLTWYIFTSGKATDCLWSVRLGISPWYYRGIAFVL